MKMIRNYHVETDTMVITLEVPNREIQGIEQTQRLQRAERAARQTHAPISGILLAFAALAYEIEQSQERSKTS